jgi:hypothetical protein
MNAGLELQTWQDSGVDIYKPQGWMVGHNMAAAFRAVLPLAGFGFLVHADVFRTLGDFYGIGLP